MRVAINGFGRIGRQVLKALMKNIVELKLLLLMIFLI